MHCGPAAPTTTPMRNEHHREVMNDRGSVADVDRVRASFLSALTRDGVHAALGFANGRTRYRFTAVYRFEPPILRNLYGYDRENPSIRLSGSIHLLDATYCSVVRATEAPFATGDALADDRLVDHPARATIMSYVGVPIRSGSGQIAAVLCHHDTRPRLSPVGEVRVLEQIAPVLGRWLADRGDLP